MSFRPAPRHLILCAMSLVCGMSLGGAGTARAEAPACAAESVTARGEPARYLWLARTKARANWRRKVRGMSNLGPDYSVWGRAQSTEERCLQGPAGTLCIFTGIPCR